jgi:hypothetical protein
MPTTSPKLPPIPPVNFPVIDPVTGLISNVWYEWFRAVDQVLRQVRAEIP